MSQYFSRENSVPDEGGNIDKRKDLVGFRGSVGRGGARSSSLLGTRSPDFTEKSLRWLRSPHGSSFSPHAAPHPTPPCPCTPQLGQTAVPLRLCWLHMLSSLCVVGVFKKKKKKNQKKKKKRAGDPGSAGTGASLLQPAEYKVAFLPRPRGRSGFLLRGLRSAGHTWGTHSQRCPPARWARGGSPRSPSGAGRDHRARTEGGWPRECVRTRLQGRLSAA